MINLEFNVMGNFIYDKEIYFELNNSLRVYKGFNIDVVIRCFLVFLGNW